MPGFEALQVLLFLLPGLVAEAVVDALSVGRRDSELGRIVAALIMAVPIYVAYALVKGASPISWKDGVLTYDSRGLLWLLGLSIGIGLAKAFSINYSLLQRILAKVGVTRKTSRPTVWLDVFYSKTAWVVVHFTDGRRLYGWPEYYSDGLDEKCLFLSEAQWLAEEGPALKVQGKGMLVYVDERVSFVEIHKESQEDGETEDA